MMTVAKLIEELQAIPSHLPVHVAIKADGSGGGADTDYHYILGAELSSFPKQGLMAVLHLNEEPT